MSDGIMDTITEEEAGELGLGRLTTPYGKRQQWMLKSVVEDMERGNIRYALVKMPYGVEVWRANIKREPRL